MTLRKQLARGSAGVMLAVLAAPAFAVILQENFDGATGAGGAVFLIGGGTSATAGWDTGLTGEKAFAGTAGNAKVGAASAFGQTTGGVSGSGAGVIDVAGVTFDLTRESFDAVSGSGGGVFLLGDGTPDANSSTANWDDGIAGETAYAGAYGGAVFTTGATASAAGIVGGGFAGGGGRLAVAGVEPNSGQWYAGLQWVSGSFPGGTALANPSFEDGLTNWTVWGPGWNVLSVPDFDVPTTAQSGARVLKMFGQFTGSPNTSGVFQDLPAVATQVWQIDAYAQHVATDAISTGTNFVEMGIEFYDAGNAQIGATFATILDPASPTDVWIAATPLQAMAPTGTVRARAVLRFQQPGVGTFDGGAGLVDGVQFRAVSGPANVNPANHTLSARVRGTAGGAGQSLGTYQLRIEDAAGNRLLFRETANGAWQTIGGPLSTAIETDSSGVPTPGAFDFDSPPFHVIIAFDNESTAWGSGGTLDVDDLVLTNANSDGSAWYAGLYWEDLAIPLVDLSQLRLTADVKGSVTGGAYVLRVEGLKHVTGGIDLDFSTLAGDCGAGGECTMLSYDDFIGGATYGSTDDYDTGIAGESAYGGLYGLAEILSGGGFTVRGLTTGGTDGAGSVELRAEEMSVGPGGGWYAGLTWPNQQLASTDLSQVELRADVKGSIASFGSLGVYELRIEDAQGDRMYFQATATGGWQSIGGPLSTATEAGRAGGGGDGNFDLNSPTYTVALAFADEVASWRFGGVLEIDNLYLTPVNRKDEIGRISFRSTANGLFQSVGGLLSDGDSTFGGNSQDFNTVSGAGGGVFWTAGIVGGLPWDDGIEGEQAFAGVWGAGAMTSVSAAGCTDCGFGDSGAATLTVAGANGGGGGGGWWAGLSFPGLVVDLSAGAGDNLAALADIQFTAKVKATVDTGAGETYGRYVVRLEDAQTDFIAFELIGDGTWQSIGGPLSTGTRGQTPDGNGSFDYNQGAYTAVLVIEGGTGYDTWGAGCTLTLDELYVSGIEFTDADSYTVTLTFADEVSSWGSAGRLTVDNLNFDQVPVGCAGDTNCDALVNFDDIDAFVTALIGQAAYEAAYPGCIYSNADCDGNSVVNFDDIDPFIVLLISGPGCP